MNRRAPQFVVDIPLPEEPEAPVGYVVCSEGLNTYHRPYRYAVRWQPVFEPSPHCSTALHRKWVLVKETDAIEKDYRKCGRCWQEQ